MKAERRQPDRRRKWWVRSPQQWFNIALFAVWGSTELSEYLRRSDTVAPSWLMETLTVIGIIGNIYLRSRPQDNERLTLRDPRKANGRTR